MTPADDPPQQEPPQPDTSTAADHRKGTAEEIIAKLSAENAQLKARIAAAPKSFNEFCYQFPSSGLFFILLGAFFLYIAKSDMGTTHAAFSFVLVVLGVAILLYGTGTQSSGNFSSNTTAAGYNIAIAGGAGILAFCIAYGMLHDPQGMKDAFQIEKKYLRITVESLDGSSPLDNYRSEFSIDGMPIPSLKRAQYIEVFVPYLNADVDSDDSEARDDQNTPNLGCDPDKNGAELTQAKNSTNVKTISVIFHSVTNDNGRPLERSVPRQFGVLLRKSNIKNRDASFDFPTYYKRKCVNLQSAAQSETALKQVTANDAQLPPARGARTASEEPTVTVAPILVAK